MKKFLGVGKQMVIDWQPKLERWWGNINSYLEFKSIQVKIASSTNCTFWSMFTNSTLFGIIFSLIKTAPKARGFEKKFQNFVSYFLLRDYKAHKIPYFMHFYNFIQVSQNQSFLLSVSRSAVCHEFGWNSFWLSNSNLSWLDTPSFP